MARQTIAAHIPTYNCPDLLLSTISEILWVDEIIIADNSSDSSIEDVLGQIGHNNIKYFKSNNVDVRLRLPEFKMNTDSDYILWVCTDEIYYKDTGQEILDILSDSDNLKDGYIVPSDSYVFGEYYGKGADQLRLFKKDKFYFETQSVHEMPKVTGSVGQLKNGYKHYNSPTFSDRVPKLFSYASMDAKMLSDDQLQQKRTDLYSPFEIKKHFFLMLLKILWQSRSLFFSKKISFIHLWGRYSHIINILANDVAPTEEIRLRKGK